MYFSTSLSDPNRRRKINPLHGAGRWEGIRNTPWRQVFTEKSLRGVSADVPGGCPPGRDGNTEAHPAFSWAATGWELAAAWLPRDAGPCTKGRGTFKKLSTFQYQDSASWRKW